MFNWGDVMHCTAAVQVNNGVEGLIIGGTTGEGQLMSWDEHIMLIAHTVNMCAPATGLPHRDVLSHAMPQLTSPCTRYGLNDQDCQRWQGLFGEMQKQL